MPQPQTNLAERDTAPLARLLRAWNQHAFALAFVWGVVEGTLFFLVPDMVLSAVAVHGFMRSLKAAACALAGGMIGGSLMYAWGHLDGATAMAVIDAVPAIPASMILRVKAEMARDGLQAMVWGPVVGIPYKIYAVQAGTMGLPWLAFVAMTIPARVPRFLITCMAFNLCARPVRRFLGEKAVPWCWLAFWIMNYAIYWRATMR